MKALLAALLAIAKFMVPAAAGVMLGGRWVGEREVPAGLAHIAQRYAD